MDKVVAARNVIINYAVNNRYDYVLFVDSDVIIPENTLIRLLPHKAFIVSGFYPLMNEYGMPIPNAKMLSQDSKYFIDFPDTMLDGEFHKVDLVGLGCCLISRQAFIKFKCERDPYGGLMKSEDWCFCEDLRKIGIKILFDTGLICKHKIREEHWKLDEA
jgi:glycosyltransferase involved in cell wall biosynthesis